jgi:hypothetical protein
MSKSRKSIELNGKRWAAPKVMEVWVFLILNVLTKPY